MIPPDTHRLTEELKDLYQNLRTAALNREVYGCRLQTVRRWNLGLEIAIAVGTSSAIASWALWKEGAGEYAWLIITGLSTVLAVIKPIINFPGHIERYSKLFVGHGDGLFHMDRIAQDVRASHNLSEESKDRYREVLQRIQELAPDDDPRPNQAIVDKCFESVKRRYPADSFWLPPSP